ncbi:PA26-domain-containing protein [Saitoella complicata NRRL Y-17804]|nr:PA26-domain-containing protein [Saitoella complicata NRRL Y-17804]ODQ50254.1 PA26-domain-containing protein [Saitoella complicata NRRL Y-17804]
MGTDGRAAVGSTVRSSIGSYGGGLRSISPVRSPSTRIFQEGANSRVRTALLDGFRSYDKAERTQTLEQLTSVLEEWTKQIYTGRPIDQRAESLVPSLTKQCTTDSDWDEVFDVESDEVPTQIQTGFIDSPIHSPPNDSNPVSPTSSDPLTSNRLGRTRTQSSGYVGPYGVDELLFPHGHRSMSSLSLSSFEEEILGRDVLQKYFVSVIRLTVDCPFQDVRRGCRKLLRKLRTLGADIPQLTSLSPSFFVPYWETVGFATSSDDRRGRADSYPQSPPDSSSLISSISALTRRDNTITEEQHFDLSDIGSPSPVLSPEPSRSDDMTPRTMSPRDLHFTEDNPYFPAIDTGFTPQYHYTHNPWMDDGSDVTTPTVAIPILTPRNAPPRAMNIGSGRADRPEDESPDNLQRRTRFSLKLPKSGRSKQLSTTHSSSGTSASSKRAAKGRGKHPRLASESLHEFQCKIFVEYGRVSNYAKMLGYFPRYLETMWETFGCVVKETQGPLPLLYKVYIGILGAAQHRCQYFTSLLASIFLGSGGDSEWLKGLEYAPRKFKRLAKINAILAHQPWRLKGEHVTELVKVEKASDRESAWTMGEVVHATCVLAMYHAQSSFALAVGLCPDADCLGGTTTQRRPSIIAAEQEMLEERKPSVTLDGHSFTNPWSMGSAASFSTGMGGMMSASLPMSYVSAPAPASIMGPYNTFQEEPDAFEADNDRQSVFGLLKKRRESLATSADVEELDFVSESKKSFDQCVKLDEPLELPFQGRAPASFFLSTSTPSPAAEFPRGVPVITSPGVPELRAPASQAQPALLEDLTRFWDKSVQIGHDDFKMDDPDYEVLQLGYHRETTSAIIDRYLPGIDEKVDRRFEEAIDASGDGDEEYFVPNEGSQSSIDTRPLREAIYYYALRLLGVFKEDFDYRDCNLLLNTRAKRFIARIVTQPEGICLADWKGIAHGLASHEKTLLALIASEAKLTANLVYAMRAVDVSLGET